ncbi:MAG: polysaccharide biosynthesis tyrosine autokinase [candidate division WOR-3 bacterium]
MEDRKEIRFYWELFKKHWLMVAAIMLGSVGASLVVSFTTKPVYQGTARMRVDLARSTSVLKTAVGTPFFVADPFQTQVNLIKSRIIAENVARRLGLNIFVAEKPPGAEISFCDCSFPDSFKGGSYTIISQGDSFRVERDGKLVGRGRFGEPTPVENWSFTVKAEGLEPGQRVSINIVDLQAVAGDLQGRVMVLMEGPTEIMSLMLTAETPEKAAMLTNAYAREYSRFIMEMDKERSRLMRRFLEEQLADMRHELDSLGDLLVEMRKQYGVFEPTAQSQIILGAIDEIEKERVETRTALEILRKQYPSAYERSKKLLPDTSYSMMEADLINLRNEKAKLLSMYKPDHPTIMLLDSQINTLEQAVIANRMAIYQKRLEELDALYGRYAAQMRDLPARIIEIERLAAKVEAGEEVYSALTKNLYEIKINENQETGIVVMVDSALPDPYPVQPRKKFNAALGFLAGLLLSILGIFLSESLDVSVRSKKVLERLTKATCLSVIPRAADSDSSRVFMEESFKLLGLSLDYIPTEDPAKVIVITSPVAGEGKSTVAVGVARALSGMGKRVLLVDGDMRKPRLHEIFGVPLTPGFSDILVGKARPDDVIVSLDGLAVIPGGTVPPDPSALLGRENLTRLVTETKERFDCIIFDCPPVLPVVDAVHMAGWASGVILVVRYGFSRKGNVAEAAERLRTGSIRLLGTVFNDVPLEIKRYTGKYYEKRGFWKRIFRR